MLGAGLISGKKGACSCEQAQEKREGEDWPEGVASRGKLVSACRIPCVSFSCGQYHLFSEKFEFSQSMRMDLADS